MAVHSRLYAVFFIILAAFATAINVPTTALSTASTVDISQLADSLELYALPENTNLVSTGTCSGNSQALCGAPVVIQIDDTTR